MKMATEKRVSRRKQLHKILLRLQYVAYKLPEELLTTRLLRQLKGA